jgi:hypothetical protein
MAITNGTSRARTEVLLLTLVTVLFMLSVPNVANAKRDQNLSSTDGDALNSTNGDAEGCGSDRFTCVLGRNAVRDNETGLVWERQPGSSLFSWEDAIRQCWLRSGQGVGGHQTSGRMGWRLPTIEQLASLVDSTQTPPSLPVGHPFKDAFGEGSGVAPVYWSATTDSRAAFYPQQAWELRLANGTVGDAGKTGVRRIWCVRGGPPADLNVE